MACSDPLACIAGSVGNAVGQVGGAVQDSVLGSVGTSMWNSFESFIKNVMESWLTVPAITDSSDATMAWFGGTLQVVTVAMVALGLIIAGAQTALASRGEPVKEGARKLFRVLLVSGLGHGLIVIADLGGVALAFWLLNQAGVGLDKFGVQFGLTAATVSVGGGWLFLVAAIGIIALLFQWGIMLLRSVIVPVLRAFWPITAAGAMLGRTGEQAFGKVSAWLLAWLLYVPLGGAVYAFAWHELTNGQTVGEVLNGVGLIVLVSFLMPALLRLLVPAMEHMGRSHGGEMAIGAVAGAVTAGVAIGAAVATGGATAGAAGAGTAASTAPATGTPASTTTATKETGASTQPAGANPQSGGGVSPRVMEAVGAGAQAVAEQASSSTSNAADGGVIGG